MAAGFAAFVVTAPAQALTPQECSAKYQAAKKDGSLGTQKWNDFRKAQCGTDATPAAAPAPAPAAPAPTTTMAKPKAGAPTARLLGAGGAVFPSAISPKYANESAGKQRMHTCLDQYNANKEQR